MREIYADHAATTRIAPEVRDAMLPYLGERFGNASSVHGRGEAAREAIERAREQVAKLARADAEEIVFTASGSEANNLALKGVMWGADSARRRLVISAIEHPSVIESAKHLELRGIPVTIVPIERSGVMDPARIAAALGPDVALVSVMWVNNETGHTQPVAEIAALAHAAGAKFHCDAVQAAGKIALEGAAEQFDLMSIAGHKFHGPQGAAALIVRRRTRLVPLVHGGHQERSRRAGTENLAAIVGFGASAERAARELGAGTPGRIDALGDALLEQLLAALPEARLNGARGPRVGAIVNVRLPGVDGEAVLHELDAAGVTLSTGSACSAASPGPSHVLLAMGLGAEDAHGSVRFSLGEDILAADLDTITEATAHAVARLRALATPNPIQQR
jgi:cysteine sulfinate desulfinase/cysteine desulfurase-like protein